MHFAEIRQPNDVQGFCDFGKQWAVVPAIQSGVSFGKQVIEDENGI
jgi:hypothetical protein